jgi:hypothetical protein|uniref:Uncharacterized protein n=1 Tax=viral metagenome TaxID=1070528 RepID=A0A6C0INR1_9ZZZZ
MNETLLTLSLCICMFTSCFAGYNTFVQDTPNQISENVVEYDNELLSQAKSVLYDYHHQNKCISKSLLHTRQKLTNRYQQYKIMKKDNEFQIPRKYMELRMDEFFNYLQSMPPI